MASSCSRLLFFYFKTVYEVVLLIIYYTNASIVISNILQDCLDIQCPYISIMMLYGYVRTKQNKHDLFK